MYFYQTGFWTPYGASWGAPFPPKTYCTSNTGTPPPPTPTHLADARSNRHADGRSYRSLRPHAHRRTDAHADTHAGADATHAEPASEDSDARAGRRDATLTSPAGDS
jgi:hypothetical protein